MALRSRWNRLSNGLALTGEYSYLTPYAFPILPTLLYIYIYTHPTECSDEYFSLFRLALERTFANGMASEAAVLVTLAEDSVAQDAIWCKFIAN